MTDVAACVAVYFTITLSPNLLVHLVSPNILDNTFLKMENDDILGRPHTFLEQYSCPDFLTL